MKNKDMPAMPMGKGANGSYWQANDLGEGGYAEQCRPAFGLTKREMFAMHAMSAYISGQMAWTDGLDGGHVQLGHQEVALEALSFADALLKELEK